MSIKVKARQKLQKIGKYAGTYRFVMMAELYNTLNAKKVIEEAALRSGMSKGIMNAAWDAIGAVVSAWATEGHSVAIPGLGTMRFGLRAQSVAKVDEVGADLIKSRRVIFTPSTDIRNELKNTSVNITCYDKDGKVIKQVTSTDKSEVEDNDTKYSIELTASPANGGTVTGAGHYEAEQEVTIKAVANPGFEFVKWSDNNTQAERTFQAEEDLQLQAIFNQTQASGNGGGNEGGGTDNQNPPAFG